ncbi:unnamed protein product [Paramecium octaurelia]|uniref:Uncharacterized protein n=1 Tax=Paramecium octaurelia TaxID=43137 RepID=A0A8S1VVY8_PAROT|nr:unnamed protein product [Paramecium octaurelia]
MVSKIILTLLIGLVTCGQSDINIQAQQQEFHACQLVCENKGINVKSQCIYTLAIRTTELLYQAEVRCNRVIEGLVNQCIRSQCVQGQVEQSLLKDFLAAR